MLPYINNKKTKNLPYVNNKKVNRYYPASKSKSLKRNSIFAKQIKNWGFSDADTYSLDIAFAQWLLPKLQKQAIINKKDLEINEIIWFLDLVAKEDAIFPIEEQHRERAYKATFLLGTHFLKLLPDKKEAKKLGIEAAKWLRPRFNRLIELKTKTFIIEQRRIDDYKEISWFLNTIVNDSYDENGKRFSSAAFLFSELFLTLWW